jgi:hypothetical protein
MNRSAAWSLIAAMGSFAFVAAGATNTFEEAESTTLGECPTGWTGYCAVSNQVGAYETTPPGTPVLTADATHARVLWVEGSAAREYAESGNRVVDLLVMAEEWPDEELPAADGDEQIKFAFDTNGCVNLYHKLVSGDAAAAWRVVSSNAIPAGTWVRTTFTFDYTHNLCQLKLDGSPCVSEYGYRSADNLTHPGSWYYMAKSDASSLASIDFVGCGGVDDVINAAKGSYTPAHSGATATNGVDYAWFDKNGLAWSDPDATAAPGGSGYTLKESFQAGTDPCSSNKLYVTTATYTASDLVLTINGCGPTYVVETSTTPFTDGVSGTSAGGTFTQNAAENTTTWTGSLPSGNLTYYRVRNTSVAAAETVNQFAIMKITSSTANTLVSLPWKSLSADVANPAAITAANVVMNNNLVNGDWLLYYDGGYKGWCLTDGAWVPTSIANLSGIAVTAAPADAELARGQAIWLVRTTSGSRDLSQPFYLYGQYQTALGSATVVEGGSLMACPDANSAFTVSASKISGAANGDRIVVPATDGTSLPKVFECRDGVWGTVVETASGVGPDGKPMTDRTWTTSGAVMNIPAGSGFMYQGTGTPTFNW